jgi:hypothetical protein
MPILFSAAWPTLVWLIPVITRITVMKTADGTHPDLRCEANCCSLIDSYNGNPMAALVDICDWVLPVGNRVELVMSASRMHTI